MRMISSGMLNFWMNLIWFNIYILFNYLTRTNNTDFEMLENCFFSLSLSLEKENTEHQMYVHVQRVTRFQLKQYHH